MKLVEKFKPLVNGYVGAEKCVEISNAYTCNFLKWLNDNDFSFFEGGIIRHNVEKTVLTYEQVLNIYDQTPK